MAFTDNGNGTGMYMPVAPVGNYYGGGNGGFGNGFGGDGAWWILILFLFAFGGGRWGNGGFGGNGNGSGGFGGGDTLAIGSIGGGYRDAIQSGFDQQAVMTNLSGISGAINNGFSNMSTAMCNGFAGVNTNLCNGFAGVNATVNGGFANAEVANNARQIANMQQAFNSQTAITSGMTGLQSQLAQCCCDNRLATANLQSTILSENCADRAAVSDGVTQLLVNQTANTQRLVDTTTNAVQGIYDKLCQLELDAKNDKIADLQNQLTMANLAASQTAQTARLLADNQAQTQALEQYLNPAPIPAYVVQNPNCCANNYYNGGCCAA